MKNIIMILLCGLILLGGGLALAQDADPAPAASPIPVEALRVLVSARTDLELLAQHQLSGQRPPGWSGSLDIHDPQLVVHVRLDLELLVGALLGADVRPNGWQGAQPGTPLLTAGDIRHDLELLADVMLGRGARVEGWAGADPILRCDRDTRALAAALLGSGLVINADPLQAEYCTLAAQELRSHAEANPAALSRGAANPVAGSGSHTPNADAYGFLDRYATQRIGIIPPGETFVPLARSYTLFSRMTLVRGSGFEVFVDWKTTSMTEDEFRVLPDVTGFEASPHCTAAWCRFTQVAGVGQQPSRAGSRALVSGGTNMRIFYDGDVAGGALVRMEVCRRPTRERDPECAAATEVIQPDGAALAPVGTSGGMRQWVLPYGYSSLSVRSACCYTTEVYISYFHERR